MQQDAIVFTVFVIFTGAAVLATLALYARQSLLVAYIALGALLGPSGLGVVSDAALVGDIASFGIMFLLFLLGLDLQPQELLRMVRKTTVVTLASSILFAGVGYTVALGFGFAQIDALVVGAAMTFSSTIIGLKLLPTTILHHQRTGEVIISVLLLQDLIAIVVLLLVQGGRGHRLVGNGAPVAGSAATDRFGLAPRPLSIALPNKQFRQDPRVSVPDGDRLVPWYG